MGTKRAASESSHDDSLIASPPSKKKQRGGVAAAAAAIGSAPAAQVTADGDEFWEIPTGSKRRVVLSSFRNTPMVSIREFYSDASGEMKPGKKGISLTVAQFSALVEAMPAIEQSLKKRGHDIPRPAYGAGKGGDVKSEKGTKAEHDDDEDEDEDGDRNTGMGKRGGRDTNDDDLDEDMTTSKDSTVGDRKKRSKDKRGKKNFEETSDEEED